MELLDIYDDNANKTGKIVDRATSKYRTYGDNEHIAVAMIYIENSKGEFLIQKTSKQKGGLYSSTGGHVDHNEKPIEAIKREVLEEIGVDISNDNIVDLGYLLVDFPLRFVFYLKKDVDLNEVVVQESEVESVSYMSIDEINEIIKKELMHPAHAKVLERVLDYKKELG